MRVVHDLVRVAGDVGGLWVWVWMCVMIGPKDLRIRSTDQVIVSERTHFNPTALSAPSLGGGGDSGGMWRKHTEHAYHIAH